jgi:hypothetical protein
MLKRLSWRGDGGFTQINDSPIKGMTHRQWKDVKYFLKRNKNRHGQTLLYELLSNPAKKTFPYVVELLSPRKHRWNNA